MRFSKLLLILTLLAGTASAQSLEEVTETAQGLYAADVTLSPFDPALSAADNKALARVNGSMHAWKKVRAWRVIHKGETIGTVFVDNVKGKARPITYLMAFDMQGAIVGLEILRYRESHGGEIQSPMFREQFKGKSHRNALTLGKDIRNISGATISSRAVTRGAHALATLMTYLLEEKKL